ncbi:MAG: glycosyltransferase family 4 protein [Verrucomicrobia bacterium]|nr:glycosyltransferase family 4 protein [Verrucomicrobiota bacterium]
MSLALCRHALTRGHACTLAYAEPGDMVEAYASAGASTHALPVFPLAVRHPGTAWRSIRSLVRLVRSTNAEWIITSQVSYVSLLALVGKLTRTRTAVHLGLPFAFPSPLFGYGMRHVTLGITPSPHTAESWKQRGWPEKRLRIIPNGVDTSMFNSRVSRQQSRAEIGISPDKGALVSYVGRIVAPKGVHTLLRAFASWRKSTNTGLLLFVGHAQADEITALRQLAAQLDLPDDAWEIRPPTNQPESFYRAADLVVVPSEWDEPFGLAPLEAMACGTLAVVSDRGVMPEFVAPLGSACVFQSGNAHSLEERLINWLSNSPARDNAATQMAEYITNRYGFAHCGDAYLEAFGGAH